MPLAGVLSVPFTSRSSSTGGHVAAQLLFLLTVVVLPASPAHSAVRVDHGAIRVQVSPDTASVRPLKEPASITIEVEGAGESPRTPVDLFIRLTAPPPGNLVSTDFPLVEGTRLVEMHLAGVSGRLSWDYVFPIRGEYRLDVSATDAQGRRLERSLALRVRESRAKIVFLAGFVAALFLLGFIAGRVFSAPAVVAAILAAALLQGAGANRNPAADTGQYAGSRDALTVAAPRVGSLSAIRWRGKDGGSARPVPATVTVRVLQLEKGREIFRLHRAPTDGTLDLAFQFTDASPHRVVVAAAAQGRQTTAEVAQTVEVEPATPPLGIRVRPVLVFSLVILAGLVAGRISKKRRLPLPWTAGRVKINPKEAS